MLKRYTTVLCFCLSVLSLWAQRPNFGGGRRPQAPTISGKISGTLLDSATRKAIPYASVTLFREGAEKAVNGTLSDDQGRFKLEHKGPGTYRIQATSLGYKALSLPGMTITLAKPDYDAGKIAVIPETVQLDAVDITAEGAVIENRIDKIVYNAENDASVAGGDATDLLRKVPLLSVDLEGNISLRGSNNIQILINGKPSGMFAGSVADALQMIPADEIKKVEVITTPTAKYDGEGSGGIVNLITKKKSVEGISGSVTAGVGNLRNNATANVAYAKGRFGLNSSGSFNRGIPRDAENNFFRVDTLEDGQLRVLDQTGLTAAARNGFSGRIGAFYDFNAYNSLTSNFRLRGFSFDREGELMATFTDPSATLNQLYTQLQDNNSLNSGYDWTTDYIRTFKKKGQEWSVGAQVSGNVNNQNVQLTRTGNDPGLLLQERSDNDGDNLELTLQTDYTHPFSKAVRLETGVK
ncbi:MAG: carboxypeptidase regulatory-like domain-containing protein, partial [Bacteroidota bacterium]